MFSIIEKNSIEDPPISNKMIFKIAYLCNEKDDALDFIFVIKTDI